MFRSSVQIIFWCSLALLAVSGCAATYDERLDYLEESAQRGVQVHKMFQGQGVEINEETCINAHVALNDDIPSDISGGSPPSDEWEGLVEEAFVNACTSGSY
ncbi:hypothetical protein [Nocardiopsis aegyptia]|uniref:Lipoprotein n=1 Tax=Nocardiopsis aegyptia TaxID=220378 RepID=A0A7Z0EI79_9ACTN|nr:hypothetical protein [Nocardiopsis aegyptia]NYJ32364.1 hypothetical protein [Nocardiopsis aegyptia]